MDRLIPIILFLFLFFSGMRAQVCDPSPGLNCENALVFCSLEELDGYVCRNPSSLNSSGPNPLCPSGGVPNNIQWFSFVAESDSMALQITSSNCTIPGGQMGLQVGVYTNCTFNEAVICSDDGIIGTELLEFYVQPDSTYYLFVDGNNGSECDYLFEVLHGFGSPIFIGELETKIPPTVCFGADLCISAEVNIEADFLWRVDGDTLPEYDSSLCVTDLPAGSIEVCVKAFTSRMGSICDSTTWHCETVRIVEDSLELVSLFDNTNGDNWLIKTNWLTNEPIENWYGISIDSLGCVNKIELPENVLSGNLPALDLPQLVTLDLQGNSLRESIPPELGDLCELEELLLNNNMFNGELPHELAMLFNLQFGKVSFANNQLDSLQDVMIFFCPFGEDIMRGNGKAFDQFIEICGAICQDSIFRDIANYPWLKDALSDQDCTGAGCFEETIISEAGLVEIRGINLLYVLSRCYIDSEEYTESITLYDCSGNRLETILCESSTGNCPGFSFISENDFNNLIYDQRWSCSCDSAFCLKFDTIVIEVGETDTIDIIDLLEVDITCDPDIYSLSSIGSEIPVNPIVINDSNIGFSYELLLESQISNVQCTTTIEVVRGSTGTRDQNQGIIEISCYPNPVNDILYCADIDPENAEELQVINLQGRVMPARVHNDQGNIQLDVNELPAGMYILVVRGPEQRLVNRFTVFR